MPKIYLACPYSHPDPDIRKYRVHRANRSAADLMCQGHVVFSPLSHSHGIAGYINNHLDHDFWLGQCLPFVSWCDELWVMQLEGWEDSRGIEVEIEAASKAGKTVVMWEDV